MYAIFRYIANWLMGKKGPRPRVVYKTKEEFIPDETIEKLMLQAFLNLMHSGKYTKHACGKFRAEIMAEFIHGVEKTPTS